MMCWMLTKQIQAYMLWELTSEIISITDWLSVTIDYRVTWYLLNMHICYFNWVITVDFVD